MKISKLLIAALLSLVFSAATAAATEKPLTVIELFTSQGCSSCPPADAYLGELAERGEKDGLLALSFHVDYWNYLGWKDPFSSAAYSKRQGDYARYFDSRNVYTPQMVIQGTHQVVGSNRSEVTRAIKLVKSSPRVDLPLSRSADGMMLTLPATATDYNAKVFVVTYDNEHFTAVKRGENRGKKIRNRNVVRTLKYLTNWNGKAMQIPVPVSGAAGDKGAVLLQAADTGAILGAASFNLN